MTDTATVVSEKEMQIRAVVRWVTEDHRPFSIVSTAAFRRMYKRLTKSDDGPPNRHTLRDRATVLAGKIRERLRSELKTIEIAAVSTDGWLAPSTQEYLCVVVHYFDRKWELHYRCLDVVDMGGDSGATNIRALIESILSAYSLRPSAITCDQGASFVKAIDEMEGVERLICSAHNINLSVNDMSKPEFSRFEEQVDQSAVAVPFVGMCVQSRPDVSLTSHSCSELASNKEIHRTAR